MPTNRDEPWTHDERARTWPSDPKDPAHAAELHRSKQIAAIDDARHATSQPPPPASE